MLVCAQTEMMQRFLSRWGPNLQEDKPPVFVGTGRTIGGFRRSSSGSRSLSLVITPELRPLGFRTLGSVAVVFSENDSGHDSLLLARAGIALPVAEFVFSVEFGR